MSIVGKAGCHWTLALLAMGVGAPHCPSLPQAPLQASVGQPRSIKIKRRWSKGSCGKQSLQVICSRWCWSRAEPRGSC